MKKVLLTSLLGAGLAATAFGQGVIQFSNYTGVNQQPVMYANDPYLGSLSGKPVANDHTEVQLFWAIGTFPNEAAFFTVANAGVTTLIDPTISVATAGGYVTGWYLGPEQIITGWTSSETVTFAVEAWDTSNIYGGNGGTYATAALKGTSAMWTETADSGLYGGGYGIEPSGSEPGLFANGPPATTLDLTLIPEPSMFGLCGMSAAALMLIRRKKYGFARKAVYGEGELMS